MSESVVRVDLRQANLSESARLRDGDKPFIALDAPPPVRSLLKVSEGEGESVRAFEVGRVIEVVDDSEPTRGCYGSFVELDRLEDQKKVGSEHLEPGISNSGVPAPVVIMSTGDMMLGEAGEEGEAAAAADAEGSDDGDSDDADADSDNANADGDASEADTPDTDGDDTSDTDGDDTSDTDGDDTPDNDY